MDADLMAMEYIAKCQDEGITSNIEIIARVRSEAKGIEAELKTIEAKRERLKKLHTVLFHLGDDSVRIQRRTASVPPINLEGDKKEQEKAEELRRKICQAIEDNGPLMNREIMNMVGNYREDNAVYRAIKFLGERQVITRDGSEDKKHIPGAKWNERENLIVN